jgi:outer membrane protein assembly factor BamA
MNNEQNQVRNRCLLLLIAHCLLFTAVGCVTTPKDPTAPRYLLYTSVVRGSRVISGDELAGLIPQKPNRRIARTPLTPALWIYQGAAQNYHPEAARRELLAKTTEFDTLSERLATNPDALRTVNRRFERQARKLRRYIEEGNWWMRNLGEAPTYFYSRDVEANAKKMQTYLQQRGFFQARVGYALDTLLENRVRANYLITEGIPYNLRRFTYDIADSRIDSLVRATASESLLKPNERFQEPNFNKERIRIEELLRNNGYYGFSRQYVRFDPDSSVSQMSDTLARLVDVWTVITNPLDQPAHPYYRVSDVRVTVTPDAPSVSTNSPVRSSQRAIRRSNRLDTLPTDSVARPQRIRVEVAVPLDTVVQNGVRYLYSGRFFPTRLLDSKIRIRPGQLYSQLNQTTTQRQLFLLNQFKFVNVGFTELDADSTQTTNSLRRLQANITATPLTKYESSLETGFFVLYQGQNVPGPFGSFSLRGRNLFGGLETFEASLRGGIEYQTGFISNQQFYKSTELGINTSLSFPQILFPGRLRFQFSPDNPRTQIGIGYNYTIRPDYLRTTLRATMAYTWQPSPSRLFSVFLADVNLINTTFAGRPLGADFEKELKRQQDEGSTLYLSFRRSFSSSINFVYTYNNNILNQNRRANFLRIAAESGGTTLNLFNTNQLDKFFNRLDTVRGLQYYKYLRLNGDFRHYIPIRKYTTLAFRVNTGIVVGYGPGQAVPYERFFFVGGSNSLRAWPSRRLGPGGALPQSTTANNQQPVYSIRYPEQFAYNFEQPGQVLLEGSAELRGRLFHLGADINGAVFVDVGNVWALPGTNAKPRASLGSGPFLSQFAVGTGVGIRFDFSFFIIRLDGAVKVWDPARRFLNNEGQAVDERFFLPQFSFAQLFRGPNPLVVNFGIGYPF